MREDRRFSLEQNSNGNIKPLFDRGRVILVAGKKVLRRRIFTESQKEISPTRYFFTTKRNKVTLQWGNPATTI